jgi:radical SAM superfamily enzyme YgiQ (UPF0313 family)
MNKREDFSLLKKANFRALFFGIESLDEGNLRRINKGIDYAAIKCTIEKAHQAGLFVVGSFIYPLPGETEQSKANTLIRLKEIAPYLDSVLIQPAGVYPCSEWGKNPQKHNIFLPADYIERAVNYPIKFIIPLRFWPPFPFSYGLMGKEAKKVTFQDIVWEFEDFSSQVWKELKISDVQDYALLIADMLSQAPATFTNEIKKILVTRDYSKIEDIVAKTSLSFK